MKLYFPCSWSSYFAITACVVYPYLAAQVSTQFFCKQSFLTGTLPYLYLKTRWRVQFLLSALRPCLESQIYGFVSHFSLQFQKFSYIYTTSRVCSPLRELVLLFANLIHEATHIPSLSYCCDPIAVRPELAKTVSAQKSLFFYAWLPLLDKDDS